MGTTTLPIPAKPVSGSAKGMTLFAVDPEEVAAILELQIPSHPTTFDEPVLQDLVARSFSITREEKAEIIRSAGRFSQEQVDALVRILTDERIRFDELNERHAHRLGELDRANAEEFILSVLGPD